VFHCREIPIKQKQKLLCYVLHLSSLKVSHKFFHNFLLNSLLEMGRFVPVYLTRTSFFSWIPYRHLSIYTSVYLFFIFLTLYPCFAFKKNTGTTKFAFQALVRLNAIGSVNLILLYQTWKKYTKFYSPSFVEIYKHVWRRLNTMEESEIADF
jgi:hypothetical protein